MAKEKIPAGLKITPLNDKVVVLPLLKDDTTASGIIIPESARQEKPERGGDGGGCRKV
jgi:co-chaperonin GroES (HSP10)